MATFCTKIAKIHGFLKFPFATLCASDRMNLAVDQIPEQSGFKMTYNTIGQASAYTIRNSWTSQATLSITSSHN